MIRRSWSHAALPLLVALGACGGSGGSFVDDGGGATDAGDMATAAGGGDMMSCDDARKRCPHNFVLSPSAQLPLDGSETLVEVIGDYRDGAWIAGDRMTWDAANKHYAVTLGVPWNAKYVYKFHVVFKDTTQKWIPDPDNPNTEDDHFGGLNSVGNGLTCANFSCAPPPVTAGGFDWRDAVLYFVFVDRFSDGNPGNNGVPTPNVQAPANWSGGDWAGVQAKVESGYFASLGVNALWLTVPVDQSESTGVGTDGKLYTAYHGYWPRDLARTESRFGSQADLKALVDAAHKANIKVILDYAMNHVHRDSPLFQMHQNDGWFNPLTFNNQSCICGSAACGWDGPNAKICWFTDYLPDFNFANAAARGYSVDNAMSWIKSSGADGFRLDAVKHIELQWLVDLRSRLTAEIEPVTKQHVYLVGETFTGDQGLIKSFIDPARLLDGQFDFPLRVQVNTKILMRQGSMQDLVNYMDASNSAYGAGAIMSTFIGNHDVPRAIHFAEDAPAWGDVWADGKDRAWNNQPGTVGGTSAYERMSVALALLYTNRGVPLLYYGDEVGMPGAGDPDNRRMMQWSNYSAGQQLLLDRVKKLGAARAAHAALRRGDRTSLSSDGDTWVYKMSDGTDTVYVALNRADAPRTVGGLPAGTTLKDAIAGDSVTGPMVTIPARSARVLAP